jgi:hypothetical protein
MKDFSFIDYEGDEIEVSVVKNLVHGRCIYVYATESEDKARVETFQGLKVICAQEVGVALPLANAKRLRDYLTAAIEWCEQKDASE